MKAEPRKRRAFLLSALFCLGLLHFSLPGRVLCHKSDGSLQVEFSAFGLLCECPFHDHQESHESPAGLVIKSLVCRDTPFLNVVWSFVEPGHWQFCGRAELQPTLPIVVAAESPAHPDPVYPGRGRDPAGRPTILLC